MKKSLFGAVGAILVLLLLFGVTSAVFIVDVTEQVVVTRMGKPVRVHDEPGIYLKVPVLESATFYSTKILDYDSAPAEVLTRDKKTLVVDSYAKWRIDDPLRLLQTVQTENGAQTRLDDIIYSVIREELGRYDYSDIIGAERSFIMHTVTERSDSIAADYGIEVLDVRIKRADLPKENEEAIFRRMTSERERIAAHYLSEGQAEATKIRAATDREVQELLARAYREAEEIKGAGDAEAMAIYAQAYEQDPEFYAFLKAMETYQRTLGDQTVLVIPHDSPWLEYLLSP